MSIRVTAEDLETGDSQVQEIRDDYCLVTAGTCFISNITAHANGTVVMTIKGRRTQRDPEDA